MIGLAFSQWLFYYTNLLISHSQIHTSANCSCENEIFNILKMYIVRLKVSKYFVDQITVCKTQNACHCQR